MKKIITLLVLVIFSGQIVATTTFTNPKATAKSSSDHKWPSKKQLRSNSLRNGDFSVYSPAEKLRSQIPAKSTNIVMQRLDSIIHEYATPWKSLTLYNDMKVVFYYDANQVQTHEILYSYDINQSVWELDNRTDFTYFPNGLVESYIDSYWDINLLQWIPGYKLEFTYDANGNLLTEEEFYMYAPSTVWEADHIYEYSWDASNQMIMLTEKYWEEDSLAYLNQYKYEYTYISGSVLTETQFGWNPGNGIWVNQIKDVYSYDMSMKLYLLEMFGWNEGTLQWDLNYKTSYSYNTFGYLEMEEGMEFFNSNWQYSFKVEYEYDIWGNRIESDNFYYNSSDSLWDPTLRDFIEYDLTYALSDLILPTTWWWFGEESAYMITKIWGDKWEANTWQDEYEDNYYYTTVNVAGISEKENTTVKVFPNPAHSELQFEWVNQAQQLTIELFDLSGRNVLSQQISNHSKLDIAFLGPGFYFYKLSDTHKHVSSGKISVQ